MRQLTPKQQRFVIAVGKGGGQTRAALLAGYSTLHEMHSVIASDNMRNPKIIAALQEESHKRLNGGAMLAASNLIAIASDPEHKDFFKATVELANRSGLQMAQKIEVAHTHEVKTRNENEADIIRLSRELGLPAPKILEYDPDTITDATFEEVPPTEEIEW